MVVHLVRDTHWVCPNCDETHLSHIAEPHTPFHMCRGQGGLNAPMVEEGISCKVEAVQREDYVNGDDVQVGPEGQIVQSIITVREDGQDCAVFAPCATIEREEE